LNGENKMIQKLNVLEKWIKEKLAEEKMTKTSKKTSKDRQYLLELLGLINSIKLIFYFPDRIHSKDIIKCQEEKVSLEKFTRLKSLYHEVDKMLSLMTLQLNLPSIIELQKDKFKTTILNINKESLLYQVLPAIKKGQYKVESKKEVSDVELSSYLKANLKMDGANLHFQRYASMSKIMYEALKNDWTYTEYSEEANDFLLVKSQNELALLLAKSSESQSLSNPRLEIILEAKKLLQQKLKALQELNPNLENEKNLKAQAKLINALVLLNHNAK